MHLAHIDFLDELVAQLTAEIVERLKPFEDELSRLDAIPGVGRATAQVLLAEIGPDMTKLPIRWPPGVLGGHVSWQL